jgi:hypothetical protein
MRQNYNILIFSFFLLNLYNWIGLVEYDYGIPRIIKYLLVVFIIGTIISYKLANPSIPKPGNIFYPVIFVFIVWSLILLIFAVFKFNSTFYIQRVLGQPYFFLPYLLPVFLLFTYFDLEFFRRLFKYSYLLIIPAILIQIFIILSGISVDECDEQTSRIAIFDLSSGFLLLTAHLSKKKYVSALALIYSFVMIIMLTQYGRRGLLIENMLLLLCFAVIRLKSSLLFFKDRVKIFFAGFLICLLFLSYGYIIKSTYVFQRGFSKEALSESRGAVFEAFIFDFNSKSDWIFGRGIDGTVLRSLRINDLNYTKTDFIENGFLMLFLKGGVIYLIPFVLIFLRASYLGFYRSNNDLVKALASLILIHVIMMFWHNLPVFATKYLFIWICVSACFIPELRNLNNDEITQKISS